MWIMQEGRCPLPLLPHITSFTHTRAIPLIRPAQG
jgi:hypothetical protein